MVFFDFDGPVGNDKVNDSDFFIVLSNKANDCFREDHAHPRNCRICDKVLVRILKLILHVDDLLIFRLNDDVLRYEECRGCNKKQLVELAIRHPNKV